MPFSAKSPQGNNTQVFKRPNRLTGIFKQCLNCGDEFYAPKWRLKMGEGKYCKEKCYWEDKKGTTPWNKDLKGSVKPNKTSFKPLGHTYSSFMSPSAYKSLHYRVNKLFGKPDTCESCGHSGLSGKFIHWANKTGKYLEDRSDWLRLCTKCHFRYDYKARIGFDYASNIL